MQNKCLVISLRKVLQILLTSSLTGRWWEFWGKRIAASSKPPRASFISISAAGCLTHNQKHWEAKHPGISFPCFSCSPIPKQKVHYHAARLRVREGENDNEYRAELIDSSMWRRSIEITGFCVFIF